MERLIIGMDFGTDSVRSVVIDADTGKELADEVPGTRGGPTGKFCDPARNMFRQHPLDYIEGMEASVKGALAKAGKRAGRAWWASASTPRAPPRARWTTAAHRSPSRRASRRTPTRCSSSGRTTPP